MKYSLKNMSLRIMEDLKLYAKPGALSLLNKVSHSLIEESVRSYLVGGFVRDILLGRDTADIDIAVAADALEIAPRVANALGGRYVPLDEINRVGRIVLTEHGAGEKWELEKPTDIAVDPAGYFYVLDEEEAQVAVFDPSYSFLTLLSAASLGGGVLEKPVTLDVDGFGDIYVYDEKEKALIRFH